MPTKRQGENAARSQAHEPRGLGLDDREVNKRVTTAIVEWAFSWCPEGFAKAMTDKIRLVTKAATEARTLASKLGKNGWASGKDRAKLVRHVEKVLAPVKYRTGGKKSPNFWDLDLALGHAPACESIGIVRTTAYRAMAHDSVSRGTLALIRGALAVAAGQHEPTP